MGYEEVDLDVGIRGIGCVDGGGNQRPRIYLREIMIEAVGRHCTLSFV